MGNRLAIGASRNDETATDAGQARLLEYDGTDWVMLASAINGEAENDVFGTSVSLSADGTRLAVGAFRNDGNGENSGHTRIYNIQTATTQLTVAARPHQPSPKSKTSASTQAPKPTLPVEPPPAESTPAPE